MNIRTMSGRKWVLVLIASAMLASSGCSMFRGKTGYELSPESRPLEIPPDLSTPADDGAMRVPAVSAAQRGAESGAFTLADTATSTYGRVGIALARIDGVTITERSQLLTVYTVAYKGETFLIRIAAQADASRVSAASTEGREISAGAGAALLGLLRERLN